MTKYKIYVKDNTSTSRTGRFEVWDNKLYANKTSAVLAYNHDVAKYKKSKFYKNKHRVVEIRPVSSGNNRQARDPLANLFRF
jgi:hypothetical protein